MVAATVRTRSTNAAPVGTSSGSTSTRTASTSCTGISTAPTASRAIISSGWPSSSRESVMNMSTKTVVTFDSYKLSAKRTSDYSLNIWHDDDARVGLAGKLEKLREAGFDVRYFANKELMFAVWEIRHEKGSQRWLTTCDILDNEEVKLGKLVDRVIKETAERALS